MGNCACGWDQGDCCGSSGDKYQFSYCKKCQCKDPKVEKKGGCPGKKQCGVAAYVGDGRCDDNNNNCGCGWDKGDCCGSTGDKRQFLYCSKCKCIDPSFKKGDCSGKCGNTQYKADGRCDDDNNNCGCGWDGGDCCGASGDKRCDDGNNNCGCGWDGGDCCGKSGDKHQFSYCSKCQCKDPAKAQKCPKKGKCGVPAYVGDGRCDDQNNNCGCNWDNGDCCGKSNDKYQFSYCKKCKCSDSKALEKCPGHCGKPNYKGDGYCDVDNNNCGCAFDGGDCCGTSKRGKLQFAYCAGKANCKCLDPEKGGK